MRSFSAAVLVGIISACLGLPVPTFAQTTPVVVLPAIDYVLLIDNSGSMTEENQGEMALQAGRMFVDLMKRGDNVTVYSFGEEPRAVLESYPAQSVSQAAKDLIKAQLALAFDEDRTDITRGVELVWAEREKVFPNKDVESPIPGTTNSLVVLLTDGHLVPIYSDPSRYKETVEESETRLRELAGLFGSAETPIHTIGLGDPANFNEGLLREIADRSGGVYHHARGAHSLLDVYYEAMTAAGGVVSISEDLTRSFYVDGSVKAFRVVARRAKGEPSGLVLYDPDAAELSARTYTQYTPELPDDVTWSAETIYDVVTVEEPKVGEWRLSTGGRISVESKLLLVRDDLSSTYQAGEPILLSAYIYDVLDDRPYRDETVRAIVHLAPDRAWSDEGARTRVSLRDDGEDGDRTAGDGIFTGSVAFDDPGRHTLRFTAMGAYDGDRFHRVGELVDIEIVPSWFVFAAPPDSINSRSRPLLPLGVTLSEHGPAYDDLTVRAQIEAPGGGTLKHDLTRADGRAFRATVDRLLSPGPYTLTYQVEGYTAQGKWVSFESTAFGFALERHPLDTLFLVLKFVSGAIAAAVIVFVVHRVVVAGLGVGEAFASLLGLFHRRLAGRLVPSDDDSLRGVSAVALKGKDLEITLGVDEFATVQFIGQRGDSRPVLRRMSGDVAVSDVSVTTEKQLRHKDEIRAGDVRYTYYRR